MVVELSVHVSSLVEMNCLHPIVINSLFSNSQPPFGKFPHSKLLVALVVFLIVDIILLMIFTSIPATRHTAQLESVRSTQMPATLLDAFIYACCMMHGQIQGRAMPSTNHYFN